jgi:hypothetical protein
MQPEKEGGFQVEKEGRKARTLRVQRWSVHTKSRRLLRPALLAHSRGPEV